MGIAAPSCTGRHATVAVVVVAAVLTACATEYPTEPVGRRVQGNIYYAGRAHLSFAEPQLQIAAFPVFPPQTVPHGSLVIERPDFTTGSVPYELRNVQPYTYFVLAELVDGRAPDDTSVPAGAFPNICYLLTAAAGNVTVQQEQATTNVSFALYDGYGAADPCHTGVQPSDACPLPGKSSVQWRVHSATGAENLTDEDALYMFLFSHWPATGPPARHVVVRPPQLQLPSASLDNDVPPGDYVAYVCLDKGGNHFGKLCGDEDLQAVFPESDALSVAIGEVLTLSVDLDTGQWETPRIKSAADLSCSLP